MSPKEYTHAEIAQMVGLIPPMLRPALVRELSQFAERRPAEVDALVASGPDAAAGDEAATVAREIARIIRDNDHLEALRVLTSVVEHYGKSSALCYLGGLGNEEIALSRIGVQVTRVQPPGPLQAFGLWRFEARGLPIRTVAPPDALRGRFDVIVSFGPPAAEPQSAWLLAEVASRLQENGIVFAGRGGTVDAAQQCYPGALVKAGLRRAIACGHMVVYVKDNPPYDAVPIEQQVREIAGILQAGVV
jgi:hypothetical protein